MVFGVGARLLSALHCGLVARNFAISSKPSQNPMSSPTFCRHLCVIPYLYICLNYYGLQTEFSMQALVMLSIYFSIGFELLCSRSQYTNMPHFY